MGRSDTESDRDSTGIHDERQRSAGARPGRREDGKSRKPRDQSARSTDNDAPPGRGRAGSNKTRRVRDEDLSDDHDSDRRDRHPRGGHERVGRKKSRASRNRSDGSTGDSAVRGQDRKDDRARRRHDDRSPGRDSDDGSADEHYDNRSAVRRRSVKQHMKPGTYDGRQSLDSFLAQFEVCASYNRWAKCDKAAFLKCALVGGPAQILWDGGDPRDLSYDQLVERKDCDSGMDLRVRLRSSELSSGHADGGAVNS